MNDLQSELEAEYPQLDIQLLGVNAFGHESGVAAASQNRTIPMLQDVDVNGNSLGDTWDLWDVEWRDVVILDADNIPVAVYNLTDNDLLDPYNFEELKSLLVAAADAPAAESSISGHVYFDTNDDGIRDGGELAISRVEILLSGTDDFGQSVNMTTRTDADGRYSFSDLPQGNYVVTQTQPSMTIDGRDTIGSEGGVASNDRFEIALGEGVDATGYNFGERGRSAKTVSLTGFFSSTRRNNMLFVSEPDGHLEWYCLQGEWSEYPQAEVETDSSTVSVAFRDNQNLLWKGSFDHHDITQVYQLARIHDKQMNRASGLLWAIGDSQPATFGEGEAAFTRQSSYIPSGSDMVLEDLLDANDVDQLFADDQFLP